MSTNDTTSHPEEWTTDQVVAYLASKGRPIAPDTWRSYVNRGQAPKPVRRVGRTPVWSPADVEEYDRKAIRRHLRQEDDQ